MDNCRLGLRRISTSIAVRMVIRPPMTTMTISIAPAILALASSVEAAEAGAVCKMLKDNGFICASVGHGCAAERNTALPFTGSDNLKQNFDDFAKNFDGILSKADLASEGATPMRLAIRFSLASLLAVCSFVAPSQAQNTHNPTWWAKYRHSLLHRESVDRDN